jgi:hypothetical protein
MEIFEALKGPWPMGVNQLWPELCVIDIEFLHDGSVNDNKWSLETCYEVLGHPNPQTVLQGLVMQVPHMRSRFQI